MSRASLLCSALVLVACSNDRRVGVDEGGGTAGSNDSADGGIATQGEAGEAGDATGAEGGDGTRFDVGVDTTPPNVCEVSDGVDAVGECGLQGPPDSFSPAIQWTFGDGEQSWVIPLVGNFTDDNGDDRIDLCDVPDVILLSTPAIDYDVACTVHVLDGETGAEHFNIPASENVGCTGTPAFGDIDNDGLPELVTTYFDEGVVRLRAFEHDGTPKWANTTDGEHSDDGHMMHGIRRQSGNVALHDLDADGDVEILFNHEVYDHEGRLLWFKLNPRPPEGEATVGADLDGDGDMEVVTGHSAYHADGTEYFENSPAITGQSFPQIADLDADGLPEILVTSSRGFGLVEHDGTITFASARPTHVPPDNRLNWNRPATIHDFDGDGRPEWAQSSRHWYAVHKGPNPEDILWQEQVADLSGVAAGTAFDFLGDGVAEAIYGDEHDLRVLDGKTGELLLNQKRGSWTIVEYPIVADVDNDGSAEILVVSNKAHEDGSTQPALQVFRDAEDRWIQARRIWNQHAYYVTNVREDSTIPQAPINNWETLNTFRTNAQIENGGVCRPTPQG